MTIKQGKNFPGQEAIETKGWLKAHKWLFLRRAAQLIFLGIFLIGPLTGYWLVKGTIASSMTFDVLPLTDPFIFLQGLLAGHSFEQNAIIGAVIVLAAYMIVSGRTYCSWVCPINVVTDAANWLREKLGIKKGMRLYKNARYWAVLAVLTASLVSGTVAWELINPITALHRGIVFGTLFAGGLAWVLVAGIFLFDLVIAKRGWCSHLCPVGAFYGLVGTYSPLKIAAANRKACNDCMDCYAVCPDNHVITPALKGEDKGLGPIIQSRDCTNCGRCIDVCSKDVFTFCNRYGALGTGDGTNGKPVGSKHSGGHQKAA